MDSLGVKVGVGVVVGVRVGVSVFDGVGVGLSLRVGVFEGVTSGVGVFEGVSFGVGLGVGGKQSHPGSVQSNPWSKNPQSSLITSVTHARKHNPSSSGGIVVVIVVPNSFLYTNVHPPNGADANL
jgi:hypothetical protein